MVIADTGFFLAILSRQDRFHKKATLVLQSLEEPLVTTWPVLAETTHLLLSRAGTFAVLQFLTTVFNGSCQIFSLQPETYSKILKLMRKYRDLPMDLADASLVLLAEHLGHGRILSTDSRDFQAYRWKDRKPFENLMNA